MGVLASNVIRSVDHIPGHLTLYTSRGRQDIYYSYRNTKVKKRMAEFEEWGSRHVGFRIDYIRSTPGKEVLFKIRLSCGECFVISDLNKTIRRLVNDINRAVDEGRLSYAK